MLWLALLLASSSILVGLAPTAAPTGPADDARNASGNTLITVQAYGWFGEWNGEAFIVTPEGDRIWEYSPPNAAVFDAELLPNGNVMVSYGQAVPRADCPERWRDGSRDHCVRNRVVEVDRDGRPVWNYTWYDAFVTHHEVHDADRLPSGETLVADMGNHRAFRVDRNGTITWEWRAEDHIGPGTAFWDEHVAPLPPDERAEFRRAGPESDWTHLNDVDRLSDGDYLLSIRNFDTVLAVDPETNEITAVYGGPGDHAIMNEQHDPNAFADSLLVADSENDRIVEYRRAGVDGQRAAGPANDRTGERIWTYEGPTAGDRLAWPRDADRLPDGTTLIADSRNFRAIAVNESGAIVWAHDLSDRRGLVYDVDRIGSDGPPAEEPEDVPAGDALTERRYGDGVGGTLATLDSWIGFLLPSWAGIPGALALLGTVIAVLGLLVDGVRTRR
jgi:hypothetical protein